ncbi:uncharacterized protein LOC110858683 [Folsomia candida]|uniref:uncharacterized protein LOC110858683 n=1 Tax=Folsomia candida TaxID=158441 RepID=UPI000B8FD794|nr:uncharacterized protein LOC110858683 [Folsomia candida]XP_035714762.1 uncharacterized protein LOC110858683 [Folsomia candida]
MSFEGCTADETRSWRTAATKTIEDALLTGESSQSGLTPTSAEQRLARAAHLENLIFTRAHPFGRPVYMRFVAMMNVWLREAEDVARYGEALEYKQKNAKLVDDLVMHWQGGGSKGSADTNTAGPSQPRISAEKIRTVRRYHNQPRAVVSSSYSQTSPSSPRNPNGVGFNVARRQRSLPYRPPSLFPVVKREPSSPPPRGNVARRARPHLTSHGPLPPATTSGQRNALALARVVQIFPDLNVAPPTPAVVRHTREANSPPPKARCSHEENSPPPNFNQSTHKANSPPPAVVRHTREANSPPPKGRRSCEANSPPPKARRSRKANSPPPNLNQSTHSANSPPPAVRHTREANSPPPKGRRSCEANSPPPKARRSRKANSPPPNLNQSTHSANSPPPAVRHTREANSPPPKGRRSCEANSPPPAIRHTHEANSPPPKSSRSPSPTRPRSPPIPRQTGEGTTLLSPPNINGRQLLSSGKASTATRTNSTTGATNRATTSSNCSTTDSNNAPSSPGAPEIQRAITNRINLAIAKWGSLDHPENSRLRRQLTESFTEQQLAQALISRMTTVPTNSQAAPSASSPASAATMSSNPPRLTIRAETDQAGVGRSRLHQIIRFQPFRRVESSQQTARGEGQGSTEQPPLPPLRISTTFPHRIITTETETVKKLNLNATETSPIIGQIFRISTRVPSQRQGDQAGSSSQQEESPPAPPVASPSRGQNPVSSHAPPRGQNLDMRISNNRSPSPDPLESHRSVSPEVVTIVDNSPVPPKRKIVVITLDDDDDNSPPPTISSRPLSVPPVKVEPTGNRKDQKRPPPNPHHLPTGNRGDGERPPPNPPHPPTGNRDEERLAPIPPNPPTGNDANFSHEEQPLSNRPSTISIVTSESATATRSPFDFTSSSPSTPGQGQEQSVTLDQVSTNQDQVTPSAVQDMEIDHGQVQSSTNPIVTPPPGESNDMEIDVAMPSENPSPATIPQQLPVHPPPRRLSTNRPMGNGFYEMLPRRPPPIFSRSGHDPDDDPDDNPDDDPDDDPSSSEEEDDDNNSSSEDDDETATQPAPGHPLNWKSLPLVDLIKHALEQDGESSRKDVTFLVGSEATPISAHTCFLAPISAKFDDLFAATVAEIQPPPLTRRGLHLTIPLSEVDPEAFGIILRYIYHREWKEDRNWSMETRIKLLEAAVKFDLIEVATRTRASLRRDLSNFTATVILDHAIALGDDRLRQSALRHIELNATTILKSDSIRALSLDGLCVIFASDDLIAEENVVYEAAKCWARHQISPVGPPIKNEGGDGDEIRSRLGRALHLVRFPIMKSDYFLNEVYIDLILPPQDVTRLVRYLCLSAEIPIDQRPDPTPYSTILRAGSSTRDNLSAVRGNDDSGGGGGGGGRGSRSSLTESSSSSNETLTGELSNRNQEGSERHPPSEPDSKRIKLESSPKPASPRPTIAGHVAPAPLNVLLIDDEEPGPSTRPHPPPPVVNSPTPPVVNPSTPPVISPPTPPALSPPTPPDHAAILQSNVTPISKPKSKPITILATTPDEDAYISNQLTITTCTYPEKKTLRALYSAISSDAPSTEVITASEIVLDTKSLFLLDMPRLQRAQIDFLYGPRKTVTNFKEYLTRLQIQSSILFFKKGHNSLASLWDSGVNVNLSVNGVNVLEVEHDTGTLKISRINSADQILQGLKIGEDVDSLLELKHLYLDEVNIDTLSRIPITALTSLTLRKVKGIKDRVNFIRSCNQTLTSFSCDDMGQETLNFGEDVGLLSEGVPTPTLARIAVGKARLDCSRTGDVVSTSSPVEKLYLDKCTWTSDFMTAIPYIFPNLRKVKICSYVTFPIVQAFLDIATLEWLGVWELEFPLLGGKKKRGASGGGAESNKRKRSDEAEGASGDGSSVDPEVNKMISLLSDAGLGNASWLTKGQKTFILEKVVLHGPHEEGGSGITKAWKGTKLTRLQKYKQFTKLDFEQFGWNVFYKDFKLFRKING